MKRERKKHPISALILIVCALAFFAATYLASPWTPVFALRPQNRCFSVRQIIVENRGDAALVAADMAARNPLPWSLTFDRVELQAMGEYTALLGACRTECDKSVTIEGWASEDISVFTNSTRRASSANTPTPGRRKEIWPSRTPRPARRISCAMSISFSIRTPCPAAKRVASYPIRRRTMKGVHKAHWDQQKPPVFPLEDSAAYRLPVKVLTTRERNGRPRF